MLDVVCSSEPAVKLEKDINDKLVEMMIMFKKAMDSQDWERAHVLILLADSDIRTNLLLFVLEDIWYVATRPELEGITNLIKAILSNGVKDFIAAVLPTCMDASSVAACQSTRMSSSADTMDVLTQRLNGLLQELDEDEVLKAVASDTVDGFTRMSENGIEALSRSLESRGRGSIIEFQLQLKTFQYFLDLAGDNLTEIHFSMAFISACIPLTLFSSSFDLDWASGTSGIAIQRLLGMLVERGAVAAIVNQCFLVASHSGSTELVRILLQIAQMNNLNVDVDLALEFASQFGWIGTMEYLVGEEHVADFCKPLMGAAKRGCMQAVQWFVSRGSSQLNLCVALSTATCSCQVGIAAYLIPHIHPDILDVIGIRIIKAAGKKGSLEGVSCLLRSNYLGHPDATYAVADHIATSEEEPVAPELRVFLQKHWSEAAFTEGLGSGQDHYVNFMRILKRGGSPICLRDLPAPLVTTIAYLPLYRECAKAGGQLLPQRLRGQLVEAVRRLGHGPVDNRSEGKELLAVLERHLPPVFLTVEAPW